MSTLRVAIVGCGRMGHERAGASARWGARVVAACDPDRVRAEELASSYPGCLILEDSARLDWGSLDAVFVCTPPFTRGAVEVAAITEGIALFVEKPIGLSADHCAPILKALQDKPSLTAVGYMNRYRNSVEWTRRSLAGVPILGVSGHWVGGMYRVPWWSRREQSGGQINEQFTHLVDLARYLVGEIEEVHAASGREGRGMGMDTAAAVSLRFAGGTLGSLFYSCLARTKQIGLRIFSPELLISLAGWEMNLQHGADLGQGEGPLPDEESIFDKEVSAFLGAISGKGPLLIKSDLADAVRTQRVVDAIGASIASGLWEDVSLG